MAPATLLLDAGNTRLKWAMHDGVQWGARGVTALQTLADLARDWAALAAPLRIVGSNVAGPWVADQLAEQFAPWGRTIEWITPQASALGVCNQYHVPAQLGSDRWAALISARARTSSSCLVVSAGTALTVDALSAEGVFLGGTITPGLSLMRAALATGTANLPPQAGHYAPFPRQTEDAIFTGALHALLGSIQHMAKHLTQHGESVPCCLLAGGDAHTLQPYLDLDVQLVDDLVLDGLWRLSQALPRESLTI